MDVPFDASQRREAIEGLGLEAVNVTGGGAAHARARCLVEQAIADGVCAESFWHPHDPDPDDDGDMHPVRGKQHRQGALRACACARLRASPSGGRIVFC